MRPKEGAFYVWTVKEVQHLLPEPVLGATEPLTSGQLLMKHYGLTEAGNISPSQVRTAEITGKHSIKQNLFPKYTGVFFFFACIF